MDRHREHAYASAAAQCRWACALAVIIVSAYAHASEPARPSPPVTPSTPSNPTDSTVPHRDRVPDHGQATADNVTDNDHRAPEPEATECKVWSPTDPACKAVCPNTGGDLDLDDTCQHCPKPPDPSLVVCQRTMPCPDPPDRRVRACFHHYSIPAGSLVSRVLKIETTTDGALLVIGVGSNQGVDKSWSGTLLVGDTDTLLAGGQVDLIRIDKGACVGKVHLPADRLASNNHVLLVRNQR